jgi:hypothetical protein
MLSLHYKKRVIIISSHVVADEEWFSVENLLSSILTKDPPSPETQAILIIMSNVGHSVRTGDETKPVGWGQGQDISNFSVLRYYLFDVTTKKSLLSNEIMQLRRNIELGKSIPIDGVRSRQFWRFAETEEEFVEQAIFQLLNNLPECSTKK